MSARETILSNIRAAKQKAGLPDSDRNAARTRISDPKPNLVPELGRTEGPERVEQFIAKLTELAGTHTVLDTEAEVPRAVSDFLKENNQPNHILMAEGSDLCDLNWHDAPMLDIKQGTATPREASVVTRTFGGVAETGSLIILSDETNPPGNIFLPENHVAIIHTSQIEANLEGIWVKLRSKQRSDSTTMPRSVNMISGPSRTGDINATMYMGAHGPKRLHVLIVRD